MERMREADPAQFWREFHEGQDYKGSIRLYDRVKQNNLMFVGRQWEGVHAPDMVKPVFNIMKRVVNFEISSIVSDSVGVELSAFGGGKDALMEAAQEQVEKVFEYCKFGRISREVLRNAAVDADGALHIYFEPGDGEDITQGTPGRIRAEVVNNTEVFFGNPQRHDPQEQPYILIESHRDVRDVKEEMKRNGRPETDILALAPDGETEDKFAANYSGISDSKVTVLTRYWREGGTIHYAKTTQTAVVKGATDSGMKRYPIAWMSWDRNKYSYHGVSVIDGLIPNQILINKLAAMAARFLQNQAFPRVFYNKTVLPYWEAGVRPIGVQGNPNDVVYRDNHATDMSSQVSEYIDKFISITKDLMGATDAALGNVNPDNTSAIIAVQQASSVPLELVKQEYYQFVEDVVRIVIDQIATYYGVRAAEDGAWLDYSQLQPEAMNINVDVGASAYWSEITSVQTLTNLYNTPVNEGSLIDPVTFLESMPGRYIPNKSRIVEELREKRQAQSMQAEEAFLLAGQAAADAMPQESALLDEGQAIAQESSEEWE